MAAPTERLARSYTFGMYLSMNKTLQRYDPHSRLGASLLNI